MRSTGFDVTTVHDLQREGLSDASQLEWAAAATKTFVTHNRAHFARLAKCYADAGRSHSGIIIATRRRPHAIAARLVTILNTTTADDMRDRVLYI